MSKSLLIAIDYDHTYSADSKFWKIVIGLGRNYGHEFVMVTGREPEDKITITCNIPIVYAGDELKRKAAKKAGYDVDIWIDDEPGTIEPCRKLLW